MAAKVFEWKAVGEQDIPIVLKYRLSDYLLSPKGKMHPYTVTILQLLSELKNPKYH